jgi:hypothetical protein
MIGIDREQSGCDQLRSPRGSSSDTEGDALAR